MDNHDWRVADFLLFTFFFFNNSFLYSLLMIFLMDIMVLEDILLINFLSG